MNNYNKNIYSTHMTSDGIVNQVALNVRKSIYQRLKDTIDCTHLENILDVGVTADQGRLETNFFENMFPVSDKITALSNQDASWMETQYPGLRFVRGDGRKIPFPDDTFDLVFSSAVLEHVGGYEQQCLFLAECHRVAKKYVFLTTPNRWHPIELHTGIPFLHWLPKALHRKMLNSFDMKELAQEDNLNLLTATDIRKMCNELGLANITITTVSFLGFPSHLLMYIAKDSSHA